MRFSNPSRFLVVAGVVLAAGTLIFGTLTSEKNAGKFTSSSVTEAEATAVVVPEAVGSCTKSESTTDAENADLFAFSRENLEAAILNSDLEFLSALRAGIATDAIDFEPFVEGEQYRVAVKDGELDFWECVLTGSGLWKKVSAEADFADRFSNSETFLAEVRQFGYNPGETATAEKFLDLVALPADYPALKTTGYLGSEPFVGIFEVALDADFDLDALMQLLRKRVGLQNLGPAPFGTESFYLTWDEMAATVIPVDQSAFGFSYEKDNFRHTRRVISGLQEKLTELAEKIETVRNAGIAEYEYANLATIERIDEAGLAAIEEQIAAASASEAEATHAAAE